MYPLRGKLRNQSGVRMYLLKCLPAPLTYAYLLLVARSPVTMIGSSFDVLLLFTALREKLPASVATDSQVTSKEPEVETISPFSGEVIFRALAVVNRARASVLIVNCIWT